MSKDSEKNQKISKSEKILFSKDIMKIFKRCQEIFKDVKYGIFDKNLMKKNFDIF